MKHNQLHRLIPPILAAVCVLVLSSACSPALSTQVSQQVKQLFPSFVEPTRTPFQPVTPTRSPTPTPTATPEPVKEITAWLDPALPDALIAQIKLPPEVKIAPSAETASIQIGALRGGDTARAAWVYAVVAPFYTTADDVSLDEVQRAWRGETGQTFLTPLMLSESTRAAFQARWGPPGGGRLNVQPDQKSLDEAWANHSGWALIPFEAIQPRWKVLHVDGMSLFDKGLQINDWPLSVWFGVAGNPAALSLLQEKTAIASLLPATNRDPNQMTVLIMTGTTALTRATAYKMDINGVNYPARDIANWLRDADLLHISNEVSFNPNCPKANFYDTGMMFCSRPEYAGLLDFIGTKIVELSGNHNNDWGTQADSYSLDLYKQHGWVTFAGGANLEEAKKPAIVEKNGNKLAFIGCNAPGPGGAFATNTSPGAAPCGDYGWLLDSIRQLRSQGYLPIVTFQYYEVYTHGLGSFQERDFKAAADAGAIIVSGSQAHFPQYMELYQDTFIHYGLGNLFFDQMDEPVVGTRQEFIDRHIIYRGKYIQTELLTALLEDYARPRPMTADERKSFLQDVFSAAGW